MPSKKQRRRRAKTFRHEYDLVLVDSDGNELPVDPEERRSEREAKVEQRAKAKPARGQTTRGGKTLREPPKPSWDRALRRGGVMGALMLLAFIFLFKSAPLGIRLAWGSSTRPRSCRSRTSSTAPRTARTCAASSAPTRRRS